MVKKVKKRARNDQKVKHNPSTSPLTVSQTVTTNVEASEVGIAAVKDRELCLHKNKEINLRTLSIKLASLGSYNCEDCHQGKKGKGRHGKKGAMGSSKSDSKAIWICLECAHFSCGGAGLPNTQQSHAVRHAKTNRHPLVVHYKNHQLLWCFPCNKLVSTEMSKDGKLKEVLRDIVKLLRGEPDEGSGADVEDVWFGGGTVTSVTKSDDSSIISTYGRAGYSVRGLINLGNTCFFNSIMQNILAIESLRDHFLKSDESSGPVTAALRKLFLETVEVSDYGSAVDPRSVFGSLCNKAPQFRGYQQHDSQELLRCLLDALSSEELNARKLTDSSPKDSKVHLTFVDAVFGGQLSSTVCCFECGHSSTVFEPFLDLSLPVPTKKTTIKRIQPVARGKKQKLPPKRSGRNLSYTSSRVSAKVDDHDVSNQSTGGNFIGEKQSQAEQENQLVVFSGNEFPSSDPTDAAGIAFDMGLTVEDLSATQKPQSPQTHENITELTTSSDCFSWLDYLGSDPVSDHIDSTLEMDEVSAIEDGMSDNLQNVSCSFMETSTASNLVDAIATTSLDDQHKFDALQPVTTGQEHPLPEFKDKLEANAQINEKQSSDCNVFNEVVGPNVPYIGSSSGSCNQLCNEDSNASRDAEDSSSNQVSDIVTLPIEYPSCHSNAIEETQVSSAAVNDEQDYSDFNGFSILFDEPEVTPELKSTNAHVSEASDSEANEVDDENTPVSVESCLALFTKPELLSKDEHAWQCDNCSKILREQMKRLQMPRKAVLPNGFECHKPNDPMGVENSLQGFQNIEKDAVDDSDGETLQLNREKRNNENDMPETEIIATKSHEAADECSCLPECSSVSCRNSKSCAGERERDMDESAETESVIIEQKEDGNLENIKATRDATKSILISKTPPILTIHLKRFSLDARGRLSKLNGHVSFKEIIDLKPYVDSRAGDKERFEYRLVGVVEHSGTMRGGHYVAYVKGNKKGQHGADCWYHTSDAYVREASLDEVLRSEAYILFYQGF